jgi:hypothetical protein
MSARFFVASRLVATAQKRPAPWVVRDGDHPRQAVAAGPFRTRAGAEATCNSLNQPTVIPPEREGATS